MSNRQRAIHLYANIEGEFWALDVKNLFGLEGYNGLVTRLLAWMLKNGYIKGIKKKGRVFICSYKKIPGQIISSSPD